jgi:hypothetical protein
MISQEEERRVIQCISPRFELVSNEESLSKVLDSHSWEVFWVERFGMDGFLTKIVCANCNLERTAIISNIQESAKVVRGGRENTDLISSRPKNFCRNSALSV